jgi:hypothetical protein
MLRLAAMLWLIVGTALAGVAMIVIVTVPAFIEQGARLIPIFCGGAFVLAMPLA